MPFSGATLEQPLRTVLAQIGDRSFELCRTFHYKRPTSQHVFTVLPRELQETDLASIPWPLRWFATGYGRHTPAALLHDYLVKRGSTENPPVSRDEADLLFRQSMGELKVPHVRRWVMWSAVTSATRLLHSPWWTQAGMALWFLGFLAILVLVGLNLFRGTSLWGGLLVLLSSVLPLGLLWGSRVGAGIIFGYTLLFFGPPTLLVLVAYGFYWLVEWLFKAPQELPRWLSRDDSSDPIPSPTPWRAL
jgi:hypothetical protein